MYIHWIEENKIFEVVLRGRKRKIKIKFLLTASTGIRICKSCPYNNDRCVNINLGYGRSLNKLCNEILYEQKFIKQFRFYFSNFRPINRTEAQNIQIKKK